MGATGGYRAPRAGLLLRHPVQGDRPSDLVLDDRRALDRSNQTHSYVKDVQGQNVRHVLGLDTLKPKGAAPKGKKKTDRGKIVRLFRLPIQRGSVVPQLEPQAEACATARRKRGTIYRAPTGKNRS